ncbi:dehydrogenase/reductase SDR family protein 7-like [Saccoglossus kowalevskii]|uniref:Dehydrogenase/reductase SDR family protein 7-like n=1 Tax=Saccoglossus kowalevskii TaxID=10224 RepID=A0ABM0MXM9_SACKO|nr:PREDICTED: dehydrogenase/reductase SDR family protein 7-like [Saccoglossus kowalevskii]
MAILQYVAALASITLGGFGVLWLIRQIKYKYKLESLRNKVVWITGASSGVGEACAKLCYKAGAKLILSSRRSSELERVRNELCALKLDTTTHIPRILPLDLSLVNSLERKANEAISFHGNIDILINNGGIGFRGIAVETSLEVDKKLMDVNYFGAVALTKGVLPAMLTNGSGHIVAVSSVQGKMAIPFRTAYTASKHAMQAFFDSLRSELADKNINVSVISPSYIKTNLSLNAVNPDGSTYGVMDKTIETGMSPEYVADNIMKAIVTKTNDVVLGPFTHKAAIYLRTLLPTVFDMIMASRAKQGLAAEN